MSKHRILIAIGVIVVAIVGVGIVTGQGSSACVTGGAVPANNAALAADCDTLLGMKSTLRGSGKLNWWTGRSIDKWDGITLGSGRVVQVSLPSKSLDGIIPAGFGNLSALQVLDLSSNSLTGTIPSELGNLTNLTRWRLSGNSLTGCVPANLSLVEDNDLAALGLSVCGGSAPAPTPIPTPTPTPASSQPTTPPTDVSERLTAIENRLATLEKKVAALEGSVATPTPTPTQTPIPTTTPNLGTQLNPVPFGTAFTFRNSSTDHWEVTVIGTTPNATSAVLDHNQFNDPPESGNQFYMVKVRAKYLGADSARFGGGLRLRALGDSAVVYTTFGDSCSSIPDSLSDPELFKNGQIEGNECWEIASSDADSLVLIVEPDSSWEGTRYWFSLTP